MAELPSKPLGPALAAMTALQSIVALALFAPGVLAPRLGLGEREIALFTTGCFAVGVFGALRGGELVGKLGSMGIATLCMMAVAGAMGLASLGAPWAMLAAGLLLGLAFGPETPASSALLGRLARPEQRPLVFSIRQTGNQIGAIIGSLTLPALAASHAGAGYPLIAAIALAAAVVFLMLRPGYDPLTRDALAGRSQGALALVRSDPVIRRLALVSMPFSAMQLGLNAFLVTYLTATLGLAHVAAGVLLAAAQAGGLIGRLGWGAVATRLGASTGLISGLGLGMAAAAATMALLPAGAPFGLLMAVAFLFGLTASGWNGVFLAEVARVAPEGRLSETTGAVLAASYAGLVVGPIIVAGFAAIGGLRLAYVALALACFFGALRLLQRT